MRLYKLKSLHGNGLLHVVDSIVNERIYLSTCEFMNDINEAHWERSGDFDTSYKEISHKFRKFADSIRFTCFVEAIDNHLMWAHYAGGFSGVALEYEIDQAIHTVAKIDYKGIPHVAKEAMEKVLNGEIHITDTGVLKTKDAFWIYENEWRVFETSNYIIAKPKALIVGPKLSESSEQYAVLSRVAHISGIRLGHLVAGSGIELSVEYDDKF